MKRYKSLEKYENENSEFLSQPIVKSFFDKDASNLLLLKEAIIEGNSIAKKQLDYRFAEHFYLYRLIKYTSTLSHHFSNDFDKKRRKQKERYLLLIDQPYDNGEGQNSMVDYLSFKQEIVKFDSANMDSSLFDLVDDELLYNVLMKLNNKEQEILRLLVVKQLKQVEVAELYGDTPQNIAKIKKKALTKLKSEYRKEVEKNENGQANR
ncbi:sigma factor-like helix-turn-helix DNA-binding protein [Cytobacillus sp. S13-E01]|uniref:sigma factor-like helix-turn-helix DNA-binding protein n=1 Tax=Cytobacillus sp. S13-E01 TaxID=3031326 RepID=UPI0023D83A20|nr:sigma factor-like helix-turn-helix DNA-binding protein [Cytobacillus sp. S13-E01]MDF0729011.1 sigma factor-like helix-turn-helix DNA-binding protein [Cytobacillus sp. S13-E01]